MIYFFHAPEVRRIKIGYSQSWQDRFYDFLVGCPTTLDMIVVSPGTMQQEQALHGVFGRDRWRGEWFNESDDLLAFCEDLRRAPECERQAIIESRIAAHRSSNARDAIKWEVEAERDALRRCVQAYIEKHGRSVAAVVAGVTPSAVAFWSRGQATIGPVALLKLASHDPVPFMGFFGFLLITPENEERVLDGLRSLHREATALICQIEAAA